METAQKSKVTKGLIFVAAIALILFGFTYSNNSDTSTSDTVVVKEKCGDELMKQDLQKTNDANPVVTLCTTMGDIVLELFMDKAPITAGNFLELSKKGFYTGTKFHRVIDGFMIQGGDPNSKGDDASTYGQGGPGYTIEDEFIDGLSNVRGTISMANIGQPNTGGSQFFINHGDNTSLDFDKEPLSSKHPVFGQVIGGLDVVDLIAKTSVGSGDLPVKPVIIEGVAVEQGESDALLPDAEPIMEEGSAEGEAE